MAPRNVKGAKGMKGIALIILATAVLASPAAKSTVAGKAAAKAPAKPAVTQPAAQSNFSLTLLYSSSAHGQIRSCNCTKFRFGGYGREATLVKSIREKTPNVIVVEGGDAVDWTGLQAELKTEVAAKALKLIGYNAMVPGEDELSRSAVAYIDRFDSKAVPILGANYHKDGSDTPAYPSSTIAETQTGIRVGIIGLLSQSAGKLFQEADLATAIKDPLPALKSALAEVKPKSDLVVVVFHGPLSEAEKLAVDGVDVVLATHRTSRDILFPEKGSDSNEVTAPVEKRGDIIIAGAETNANWSLGRIDLEISGGKVKSAAHKLLYLDRRYDEDPQMVSTYEEYNKKVKDAVLTQSAKFKADAEALLVKRGLNLDQMRSRLRKSPFVGAGKCKECHPQLHEIWSGSRHAKAMDTLKSRNQEFDPECISCHATGVMVRNGFTNMKDTPELANVQCEACHGPAEQHVKAPAKGFGKVHEQTCRACHTDERTPDFDYAQEWAKIMH